MGQSIKILKTIEDTEKTHEVECYGLGKRRRIKAQIVVYPMLTIIS